jgi:two-component system, OmpR family, phosphate regulon response regulator PhoB
MPLALFFHPWHALPVLRTLRLLAHIGSTGFGGDHRFVRTHSGVALAISTLLVCLDVTAPSWPSDWNAARRASPRQALRELSEGQASAVVLASAHGDAHALDWLARLRATVLRPSPTALMLLQSFTVETQLAALRAGADAVLPLDAPAVLVEAQLSRLSGRSGTPASLSGPGGLRLEAAAQRVWVHGQPLPIKPGLFRLLWCLMAEPDRVFSLAALRDAVEADARTQDEAIHAYVSRLRKALRPHGIDRCIQTVHRVGYRYAPACA